MVFYQNGSMFDNEHVTLVNPVNTVGVMGKGLAAQFKARFPHMFAAYKEACNKHLLEPGKLMLVHDSGRSILLFPTKMDWRNHSELEYIELGMKKLAETYDKKGIQSIAIPPLGCGLGGLDKQAVLEIICRYADQMSIDVILYNFK